MDDNFLRKAEADPIMPAMTNLIVERGRPAGPGGLRKKRKTVGDWAAEPARTFGIQPGMEQKFFLFESAVTH
jgi:hypothetical protein